MAGTFTPDCSICGATLELTQDENGVWGWVHAEPSECDMPTPKDQYGEPDSMEV